MLFSKNYEKFGGKYYRDNPRIVIIGCGAVTDFYYLPKLVKKKKIYDRLILVDSNSDRLNFISKKYDLNKIYGNYKEVIGLVDGAIVALPPALHFPITKQLIKANINVLCEKPLSETFSQAKILVNESKKNKVNLLVNNTRRLYPSSIAVKKMLENKQIGDVTSIELYEGGEFRWPTVSGFYFTGKNGVLLDRGIHGIDLICWWLGKPKIISYTDDSFGGAEAMADIKFKIGDIDGSIKLNLLYSCPNNFIIKGTRGKIIGDIHGFNKLIVIDNQGLTRRIDFPCRQRNYADFIDLLLDNFIEIIQGKGIPLIPVETVVESIGVIEECYRKRKRYNMDWI